MAVSPEHIKFALEPLDYLNRPLEVGSELFDSTIKLCRELKFDESIQICCELYQLGLKVSDSYVQGVAWLCLGSVYFALGEPDGNWDRAAHHFRRSARLFHTFFDEHSEHNEGIAELALGRLYEKQCAIAGRDRWKEAITSYEKARELFCDKNDPLVLHAERSLHRVTEEFRHQLSQHSQNAQDDPKPTSAPEPGQSVGGAGQDEVPSQSQNQEEGKLATDISAPRERVANFAIKVVPHEPQTPRRFLPNLSRPVVIGSLLVVLAIIEIVAALFVIQDPQAQIILLVMFLFTLLVYFLLALIWRMFIWIGAGSVGVVTGGAGPRLIYPGRLFLRMPLIETLYDIVPTVPMRYNCRVEFREQETAALPDLYQDIYVQYRVVEGQSDDPEPPLRRAVLNQLAQRDGNDSRRPMVNYWTKQIADGLQRYFEDLEPDVVLRRIKDPQSSALEEEIKSNLQGFADRQGWGIDVRDLHLRHYQQKR